MKGGGPGAKREEGKIWEKDLIWPLLPNKGVTIRDRNKGSWGFSSFSTSKERMRGEGLVNRWLG